MSSVQPVPSVQSSNPDHVIPTRRVSFDESLQNVPKHFAADGDLVKSHLAVCMSAVFPDGEDFFVRSVRHFRDQITDPVLKRQVAGFIGQESVHGREHRALNARFQALGYNPRRLERITRTTLGIRSRVASPMSNLAATAALEHFTATLAEQLMSNPEMRAEFGDDDVRNVFLWHALEESEHKSVAFDVYRAVGGSERLRVWTMRVTRFGFVTSMIVSVLLSLLRDRETYRRGALRESIARFRKSPLVSHEMWEQLKEYDRRGFHPEDRNTDDLTAEWREKLFGDTDSDGELSHLLAGAATSTAA